MQENSKGIKQQIVDRLNDQAKNLELLIEGGGETKTNTKHSTITDSRAFLLDHEGKNKSTYRVKNKKNAPTEIELEAMKRWEK